MNYDELSPQQLVDLLGDKKQRYDVIVALIGGITSSEMRQVTISESVSQALIDGLKHEDSLVRWWCIQLMDHLADESFADPLIDVALTDPLPKNRRHAIHALTCEVCKPDRCALNVDLRSVLKQIVRSDVDWSVRLLALDELTKITGADEATQLIASIPGEDQAILKAITGSQNSINELKIALACTASLDSWRGRMAYQLLETANRLMQGAASLLKDGNWSDVNQNLDNIRQQLAALDVSKADH